MKQSHEECPTLDDHERRLREMERRVTGHVAMSRERWLGQKQTNQRLLHLYEHQHACLHNMAKKLWWVLGGVAAIGVIVPIAFQLLAKK